MGVNHFLAIPITCLMVVISLTASADDVILNRKSSDIVLDGNSGKQTLGDFDCSQCPSSANRLLFDGRGSGTMTAGELWTILNEQGMDSVNRLTFSLDVLDRGQSNAVGIESMELRIEDLSHLESPTIFNLGSHGLLIPDYDIVAFKPEANLEVDLGFDFMKRYTSDSTEKISLVVAGDADSQVAISVGGGGGSGLFSWKSLPAIGLFLVFWGLIFLLVNRFTKPQVNVPEKSNVGTRNRQALSA